MNVEEIIENNLKPYLNENKKLLLGVSGGKDSMLLLHVISKLKEKYDFEFFVLHVNHGVRGLEAERDLEIVRKYCEKIGAEFFQRFCNMREFAKEHKLSEEEAGRELRIKFFSELKRELDIDYVVLAHHGDDQAETVLFRILRGTGVKGLGGMRIKRGDILRPLLSLRRTEIEEYIEKNNIPYGEDSTNFYNDYTRNKIRNVILPFLKREFDFDITNSLLRLSDNARELWDLIEKDIDEAYPSVIFGGSLSVKNFEKLSEHMRLLILHRAFKDYSLDRETFLRMSDWIIKGKSGSVFEFHGGVLKKSFNIVNVGEKSDLIRDFCIPFEIDKEIRIDGIGTFNSMVVKKRGDYSKNTIYIDRDKLKEPCYIRNRRPGDKIFPYGMQGGKTLKDILREERISSFRRDNIPILESCGEIVWIAGIRDSRQFKIDENTKEILMIEFKEEKCLKK